jgi:hypothetical protein
VELPPVNSQVRWHDPRKLKGATGIVRNHYELPFGCENGCREHFWVEWQGTALSGGFCPVTADKQVYILPKA